MPGKSVGGKRRCRRPRDWPGRFSLVAPGKNPFGTPGALFSSICIQRVVNILFDMTRATLQRSRFICLGVVLAFFCSAVRSQPVWAEEGGGEEEDVGGDYKDPTIVTDDSSSVPVGVKDIGKEKKPIVDPVYGKWWFWAATIAVAGAWVALAVWPSRQKAPGCASFSRYQGNCIGDGR
jgi:hypothetical protein